MAGQTKISALTSTTTIANGDIIHVVVNPASSPVNRKMTFTAFADQLVAARSLANTDQANAAGQINTFSFIEVANSTTLEAGQSNDVLRFSNGVGIALSTDGAANVIIATANNTQEQRVRVANNSANVGDARPIIDFQTSGNTDNITINISESIANDSIVVNFAIPDKALSDLTNANTDGSVNGALLFLSSNSIFRGSANNRITIDSMLPATSQYEVVYDVSGNTVTMDPLTGADLPTAYLLSGSTIAFKIPEDPSISVRIANSTGGNVTEGVTHVDVTGEVTAACTAADDGTLYWNVKPDIGADTYQYIITAQSGTVTKQGNIVVKDITSL